MSKKLKRSRFPAFKLAYGTMKDSNLAKKFGISSKEVERLAVLFCLGKDKKVFLDGTMPRWTDEEVIVLRKLYPHQSTVEVATQMGRTVKSIVAKAYNLGMHKTTSRLSSMGKENRKLRGSEE